MYETSYRGIRYCFQEDCLVLNDKVIEYKEMSSIKHRGGEDPAFIFEYQGKQFAMPYPPEELQEILPYMKKASKMTPPLSSSEPIPVEEMSIPSENVTSIPVEAEIIPERTAFNIPPETASTPNKKSKKKGCLVGIGIIVLLLILLFACVGGGEEPDKSTASDTTNETQEETTEPTAETEPDPLENLSTEERNAYGQAVNYLNYTSFSRSGLIDQLKYEGYSEEACEKAVSLLEEQGEVDWTEQCKKKAQEYLDYTEFSRDGLIDQLEYEGFSDDQINSIIDEVA